jgi:hypothetical protein
MSFFSLHLPGTEACVREGDKNDRNLIDWFVKTIAIAGIGLFVFLVCK